MAIIVLLSCQKEELALSNSKLSNEIDNVDISDHALRGKKERVTVYCHFDDATGRYVTKEVNEQALKAHVGHGDLLEDPGECCSSEGLHMVTLPDGSTIYVQPVDNSPFPPGTNWGPLGGDILNLTNFSTSAEAAGDLDGWSNTNQIVDAQGAGGYAAKICADLVYGGCDNWYLPSAGELMEIYKQLGPNGSGVIQGFGNYWSSTEQFPGFAWRQSFFSGNLNAQMKQMDNRCRCVRR